MLNKALSYSAILLLTVNYLFYHTLPDYPYKDLLRIVSIVLLVIAIIVKGKIRLHLWGLFILAYFVIGFILGSEISMNLMVITLILYALPNNKWRKNSYAFLAINIIVILIYFMLLSSGNIHNTVTQYGGRIRNTIGFDNVNAASLLFAPVFFIGLASLGGKWNILILPIVISSFYLSSITDSRTLFYSTLLCVFLKLIFQSASIRNRYFKFSRTKLFEIIIVLVFMSPILLLVFGGVGGVLDKMLSFRIAAISNFIHQNSLLNILIGFSRTQPVDNSFIVLLYGLGLFIYALLIMATIKYFKKEKDIDNHLLMASILSYATMEAILIRPECFLSILFWGNLFNEYVRTDKTRKIDTHCENMQYMEDPFRVKHGI